MRDDQREGVRKNHVRVFNRAAVGRGVRLKEVVEEGDSPADRGIGCGRGLISRRR